MYACLCICVEIVYYGGFQWRLNGLFLIWSTFSVWNPSWGKACLLLNQNTPTHTHFHSEGESCPFGFVLKSLDSSCGIQRLVSISLNQTPVHTHMHPSVCVYLLSTCDENAHTHTHTHTPTPLNPQPMGHLETWGSCLVGTAVQREKVHSMCSYRWGIIYWSFACYRFVCCPPKLKG